MSGEISRRIRLDSFTPAERAIWDAHQAVEALPPDERLTRAGMLLSEARSLVADFVDGVPLGRDGLRIISDDEAKRALEAGVVKTLRKNLEALVGEIDEIRGEDANVAVLKITASGYEVLEAGVLPPKEPSGPRPRSSAPTSPTASVASECSYGPKGCGMCCAGCFELAGAAQRTTNTVPFRSCPDTSQPVLSERGHAIQHHMQGTTPCSSEAKSFHERHGISRAEDSEFFRQLVQRYANLGELRQVVESDLRRLIEWARFDREPRTHEAEPSHLACEECQTIGARMYPHCKPCRAKVIAMFEREEQRPNEATHRCGHCGLEKNENAAPGSQLPPCTVAATHAWDDLRKRKTYDEGIDDCVSTLRRKARELGEVADKRAIDALLALKTEQRPKARHREVANLIVAARKVCDATTAYNAKASDRVSGGYVDNSTMNRLEAARDHFMGLLWTEVQLLEAPETGES